MEFIRTEQIDSPRDGRRERWIAWYEGEEDLARYSSGRSREEAIENLKNQDEDDI